ncbi:hypothetical protein TI39_contig4417g00007 [Zymoseptoria brevis]|uniref:Major facilitator superfamily (MFS) profile domain-containing protein n=1 Tax=Zymoseptoria brevis TaxID=1047168 RepID=A0A0F4GA56_9PEZI|nr:hypothetical protein TI39_contig4417g00007 [Zymoseptoria brevis]
MATQFHNISSEESISKPETDSGVADGVQAAPLQTTDVGTVQEGACYSVLSERQKIALCLAASLAAIIAPFSANIYYPAIHTLAQDLDVSVSKINLTVSSFQIFQGLGPFITAALSETYGRRMGYLVCLAVYAAANLALALQNSYPALLVLRILQSSGSSGTLVITQALVADIATRAERGRYIAFATMGFSLGPALGPVVGGLFSQYLGWRAIFWFLLGLGAIVMLIMLVFIRETCRSIVGDGSVPPPKWGRTLVQVLSPDSFLPNHQSLEKPRTTVTPLRALQLLTSKVNLIVVLYGGFAYAGYVSITVTLSSQLHARYGYSDVITGVCYLAISLGSLSSFLTSAALTDWNFKREAKKQGVTVVKKQQTDIRNFDIERARLAVVFPMLFLACGIAA